MSNRFGETVPKGPSKLARAVSSGIKIFPATLPSRNVAPHSCLAPKDGKVMTKHLSD